MEFITTGWFAQHASDEEIHLSDAELSADLGAPPDGTTTGTVSVKVTDQNGQPVQGVKVSFSVAYVRPGGKWRSADGLRDLYNSKNGDGGKAKRLVSSGVIRVLGSINRTSSTTNGSGVASVEFRSSHIGSDFAQSKQARERVIATLPNGKQTNIDIDIGWTGLKKITPVSKGLRVIGALGERVHPSLHGFLRSLGGAVAGASWPHPVTVTAASLRWGGQYPPHFTHKHGLSLDLRPMSTDGAPTRAYEDGKHDPNYDFGRTKVLISVLKESGAAVYFSGKGAGGTPKPGHHNHIHASWLTSARSLVIDRVITASDGTMSVPRATLGSLLGAPADFTADEEAEARTFLAHYGYLQTPEDDGAAAVKSDRGALAQALIDYQRFFGLPQTGVIDEPTRIEMSRPRCGVADHVPSGELAAFALHSNTWPKKSLTYSFDNYTPDLSRAAVEDAIARAFRLWSDACALSFRKVSSGGDIRIKFGAKDHGDKSPFDGPGGTLAHAYYPPPLSVGSLAGDAHFDEDESWTVNLPVPSGGIDLVTVAAHEFGHSIGLKHSAIKGALMFPSYSGAQRHLHADDIAGAQKKYGK